LHTCNGWLSAALTGLRKKTTFFEIGLCGRLGKMRTFWKIANYLFSGLRFRLLVLVVLTCAPLVALTLHTAWEDRRKAVIAWRQRSERVVQLAGHEEDRLITEGRRLLLGISMSDSVKAGDVAGCKRLLPQFSGGRYVNLSVVETNGQVLASAKRGISRLSSTESDLCRRVIETGAFMLGDFPAGEPRAKTILNFAYPVFNASGQPERAVLASVDVASWLNPGSVDRSELATQLRGATWTQIDRKGLILVRCPSPRTWIGQLFPDEEAIKTFWSKREGLVEAQNSAGVPTLYAFSATQSQLTPNETVGVLSIPKDTLFAAADRTLFRNLGWLGLAAALALTLGWFGSDLLIVRPVKALVQSSARLASGDLSVRTGLRHGRDELGRLMLAFDRMANALEFRENERRRASQKLQIMSQRLVEVQESERRHIARELHDEIGQSLTVAEMNLQAALQTSKPGALTRRLEDSIEAVERVLEQVHDLSLNLRPSMLDDLGLEPALRWYANRQASAAGLQVRFKADPIEDRLDPLIETECFRVGQEALTNVVRHAKAHNVAVNLERVDGQLHLSVKDDGIGFDVSTLRDEAVRGASLGLLSMEERATLAGGGLKFHSAPGKGTEVHAWFPLKWRTAPNEGEI
jgi:signal transduction histidine kinase